MSFNKEEQAALLAVKGVGPTVIKRLEEIGIDSFEQLSHYAKEDVVEMISGMLNSRCWKNSPQALNAIDGAIARAQKGL